MSAEYQILRYRPEHRSQVLRLQEQLWSSDPELNAAYFRWKYEVNPYLGEVAVYLAVHRGEVVGMRGFFGSRWEAGIPRQELRLWCADDLVIAPEHRNQGLFTSIMQAALEDLAQRGSDFALSLSSGELTVLGSLTMGWKSAGTLQPLGLPSRRYRRLYRWRQRLRRMRFFWRYAGASWLNPPCRFDRLDRWAPPPPDELGPIRVTRHPESEAMAALVEELGYDGRIRHVRDAQYFDWRFRNPLREYRFLYLGAPRLRGYLVLHRSVSNRDVISPIHLSDWEARAPDAAAALLRAALRGGKFPAIAAWGMALPRGATGILATHGFRPIERERTARGSRCALVRPLRPGVPAAEWKVAGKSLLAPESWDLRMLYSMMG